jgi:hypothetical protein
MVADIDNPAERIMLTFVLIGAGCSWMFVSRLSLRNATTGSMATCWPYHALPPGLAFASFSAYCNAERAADRNALSSKRNVCRLPASRSCVRK